MAVPTHITPPEATRLIRADPHGADFFARAPVAYQLDPQRAKIDERLDNERRLRRASLALAHSAPHALESGRPATPVAVSVRLAVWRRRRGWSDRQVEAEGKGRGRWRGVCHLDEQRVPAHRPIPAREALIAAQTLHAVTDWVVQHAYGAGGTPGKQLRAGSSIVEPHLHDPTASSLLAGGGRVVGRPLARAREVGDGRTVRGKKAAFCTQARKAKRLARASAPLARHQGQEKPAPQRRGRARGAAPIAN